MNKDLTTDIYAAARHARYGKLPERIRYEDMAVEVENAPARTRPTTPQATGSTTRAWPWT